MSDENQQATQETSVAAATAETVSAPIPSVQEPPKLTPQQEQADAQVAQIKVAREADEAKAKELTDSIGKQFRRKDGKGYIAKIVGYGGIGVKDGRRIHCLIVEAPGARWTPGATEFLQQYEQVTE
jgi:hypothetical protein